MVLERKRAIFGNLYALKSRRCATIGGRCVSACRCVALSLKVENNVSRTLKILSGAILGINIFNSTIKYLNPLIRLRVLFVGISYKLYELGGKVGFELPSLFVFYTRGTIDFRTIFPPIDIPNLIFYN